MDDDKKTAWSQLQPKIKSQEEWKNEAIEIAIIALNGATHREKESNLKMLLLHLTRMPVVSEFDIGGESDEIPF